MKNIKKYLPVFFILLAIAGLLYMSRPAPQKLPILGEQEMDTIQTENGQYKIEKKDHHIKNFSFLDQTGKVVTQDDFKGSLYVTDYFFTNCHGICPIMTNQMEKVYNEYKDNVHVKFLSHTVNPERDSVPVLNEFAKLHNADPLKWHFVTGDKKALYDIARNDYLLSATQGNGGPEDFIHTQNFALIDPDKRIRGFYDGTDSIAINKLIKDIDILLEEYNY